jgi:hypothetical protein
MVTMIQVSTPTYCGESGYLRDKDEGGGIRFGEISCEDIRGCIQKFPDWPPGARTANGTALCH